MLRRVNKMHVCWFGLQVCIVLLIVLYWSFMTPTWQVFLVSADLVFGLVSYVALQGLEAIRDNAEASIRASHRFRLEHFFQDNPDDVREFLKRAGSSDREMLDRVMSEIGFTPIETRRFLRKFQQD